MNFKSNVAIFVLLLICQVPDASAQLLIDSHVKSNTEELELNLVLSHSEIEYEVDRGGDEEVERTILGLAGAFGINPSLDIYGEIGYILEAELGSDDDDGFIIGGGLRGVFYREGQLTIHGRGGLRFIDEEYGKGKEGQIVELELGVTARYDIANSPFAVYGGLDLVPYSDGDFESGNRDSDIDRDNALGLRLGSEYSTQHVVLNGEIALISEEGITLRIKLPI